MPETRYCLIRECGQPVDFYKLVSLPGPGGIPDPSVAVIGEFCGKAHADLVPSPTPEAVDWLQQQLIRAV